MISYQKEQYLDEVLEKLKLIMRGEPLILLGPGFVKEALAKRLREKAPGIASSITVQHTGQAGMAGIHEIMKQGVSVKILEQIPQCYGGYFNSTKSGGR